MASFMEGPIVPYILHIYSDLMVDPWGIYRLDIYSGTMVDPCGNQH